MVKKCLGKGIEKFFSQKIDRKEFLKKLALGIGGLGLGIYGLNKILQQPKTMPSELGAPKELWKWSKECYNYNKLANKTVQCLNCPNKCIIPNKGRSYCRNKANFDGKFYTLVYGNPCAVHVDPIEKKPLFHFLPGTTAFSIGTAGCNFRCLNCQNWNISQMMPEETTNMELFPEGVVSNALKENCPSIGYTYNEPSTFYEYMHDTSKLGKEQGLRNCWITNGYLNEKPLRDLCKYLDAANVNLKSFKEEIYNKLNSGSLQPVLNTLKTLKEEKVWFEVTTLMVPTYVDDVDMIREMCRWLVKNIGQNYPLHFLRFNPEYKLTHLPVTSVKTLETARKIAVEEGLKFVYIGNVAGHEAQNSYCPKCKKIVIERAGYVIKQNNLESGSCKFCGEKIMGIWK